MRKIALALSLCSSVVLFAAGSAHERLSEATKIFNEVMATPDKGIPQDLLKKAHCIVIVPSLKQGAPGIDGKFGRGYAACRQNQAPWGGPAAIRLVGGSAGFQIGASNPDIIMLVMNESVMHRLMEDEIKLGSQTTAGIISWSRSKGVFAGISLQGVTLQSDDDVNMELYGSKLTNKDILAGDRPAPSGMMGMLSVALNRYSPRLVTGGAKTKK